MALESGWTDDPGDGDADADEEPEDADDAAEDGQEAAAQVRANGKGEQGERWSPANGGINPSMV